uniref:cadherin-13-like n=1 Tax=Myxine glutinosa TaxID=7769 RepID=UPI00358E66A5
MAAGMRFTVLLHLMQAMYTLAHDSRFLPLSRSHSLLAMDTDRCPDCEETQQGEFSNLLETESNILNKPRIRQVRQAGMLFVLELSVSENGNGPFPQRVGQVAQVEPGSLITLALEGPGIDEDLFSFNGATGEVFVHKRLDRENKDLYKFTLKLLNSTGIAQKEVLVIVNVIDQNDHRPQFLGQPYVARIPEHSEAGTIVLQFSAQDDDDANTGNGELRYSLLTPDPNHTWPVTFEIDPNTGELNSTTDPALLDRESLPMLEYTVVVKVSDNAGSDAALINTATAKIIIEDINDHSPAFLETSVNLTVEEGTYGHILNLTVFDDDLPGSPNWLAVFNITSGDPYGHFNISTDPDTNVGILEVVEALDYETMANYVLKVKVTNEVPLADRTTVGPNATVTINLKVKDQNEPPVFSDPILVMEEPENMPKGTTIITLNASDPDTHNQRFWYKIGSDPAGWLKVNSDTGEVTTTTKLDRESSYIQGDHNYTATFLAIDNGSPVATSTATLLIYLEDENDNAPTVSPIIGWACHGKINSTVALLTATDIDLPPHAGPFSFSLGPLATSVHSKTGHAFRLNHNTRLQSAWNIVPVNGTHAHLILQDKLPKGQYLLPVHVSDSGRPMQSNQILFNASVCSCYGGQPVDCISASTRSLSFPATFLILLATLSVLLLL